MSGAIYPFLDDLNATLRPHFAGTQYEQLFVGNFVDRVHTFDLSQWNPTVWNPAELVQATEINRIYCTLGYHMSLIDELMCKTHITSEIKYFLTMYMDMHMCMLYVYAPALLHAYKGVIVRMRTIHHDLHVMFLYTYVELLFFLFGACMRLCLCRGPCVCIVVCLRT